MDTTFGTDRGAYFYMTSRQYANSVHFRQVPTSQRQFILWSRKRCRRWCFYPLIRHQEARKKSYERFFHVLNQKSAFRPIAPVRANSNRPTTYLEKRDPTHFLGFRVVGAKDGPGVGLSFLGWRRPTDRPTRARKGTDDAAFGKRPQKW